MSDRKVLAFRAAIISAGGGGAFVRVPFDVEAEFGRKRVPVRATIDGVPYRGTLMRMGEPCHMLGVLKSIREQIGKAAGGTVAPRRASCTRSLTVCSGSSFGSGNPAPVAPGSRSTHPSRPHRTRGHR